jgi:hypothetical protein
MGDHHLEKAIYDTVRYFDLLDMPLTATQIWRCLVIDPLGQTGQRWGGHRQASLRDVQRTLDGSMWLKERLGSKWGYVFLRGRDHLGRVRLTRHGEAERKWKLLEKAAVFLAAVPFVRGIAASGSLAIDNTKPSSDLDVFVIVKTGRMWTARLLALGMVQLLGRRRKYWNRQAPDMVCLNHYVADEHLKMPVEVTNLYTAVQYTLHVPLHGLATLHQFQDMNASWVHRYVMAPIMPHLHHRHTVTVPGFLVVTKKWVEGFLLEPFGNVVEGWAKRLQLVAIARHQVQGRPGRVALSEAELAFHPDTKVPSILGRYTPEAGQRQLL